MRSERRKQIAVCCMIAGAACCAVLAAMLWEGRGFKLAGIRFRPPWVWLLLALTFSSLSYWLWPGTRSPGRKAGQLALLGMSAFLSLAAVEIGIRSFLQRTQGFNSVQQLYNPNPVGNLPTRSSHPLLVITRLSASSRIIYELKPNVNMSFGHNDLRINSQGMREDREFSPEKPDGTLRIVGLGDSGMWGWDVHQGEDYLSVLEDRLRSNALQSVEVLNFAVPGYNCFQELETLRQKALAYQPDVVVVGWCYNDNQLPFFMYTRKDHWAQPASYVYAMALDRGAFLELVSPEVLKLGDIDPDVVDPEVIAHTGWEGVERCLSAMHALSEEHGFHLLLFGPMKDQVRGFCDRIGIRYYNTYEKIRKDDYPSEYAVHFMHPAKAGHAVLAEHLEIALRELVDL